MKRLLPIIIVLLLAVSAFGQSLSNPPQGFKVAYNKFTDSTKVYFAEHLKSRDGLAYLAEFGYPGPKLENSVGNFVLIFSGGVCDGYCFQDPLLIFLIDGDRVVVGRQQPKLADAVTWVIDRKTFARIANAKLVEYQVGTYQGKWEGDQLARFKTLLDLGTVKM